MLKLQPLTDYNRITCIKNMIFILLLFSNIQSVLKIIMTMLKHCFFRVHNHFIIKNSLRAKLRRK